MGNKQQKEKKEEKGKAAAEDKKMKKEEGSTSKKQKEDAKKEEVKKEEQKKEDKSSEEEEEEEEDSKKKVEFTEEEEEAEESKESGKKASKRELSVDIASSVKELLDTVPEDVQKKIEKRKVKSGAILKAANMQTTSTINKFKPPVSLQEALEWIIKNKAADVSLILEDDSAVTFNESKFTEFDDMGDESDE